MSIAARKQKTGLPKGRDAAIYVYCVGDREPLSRLSRQRTPSAVETRMPVELVTDGNLAAVVSVVSRRDYSGAVVEAHLKDPTWVAIRALRHEKVVEHFATAAGVVPLRFGTVYLSRAAVARMLSQKQRKLSALVKKLRGREEWGLVVLRDRSRIRKSVASSSQNLRELGRRAAKASPGRSYLLMKKIDASRDREATIETKRAIRRIERELSAASEGVVNLHVSRADAAEVEDVAAKLAFLVKRDQFDAFIAAAEHLARLYSDFGLRLELTGPWPAYNFASTKS